MVDTARKYIEIVADGSKAIQALKGIEQYSKRASESLSFLQRQAKQFGTALAGYLSVRAVQGLANFSDTARDTAVRLEAATSSTKEFEQTFQDLLVIGNKTGTAIDVLASSFSKLKVSIPTATTQDIVDQLDLVSTVMSTTGKSTQQVNAVFLQLSQALASGALQGDEFRAVFENAPELLRAWQEAAGLADQQLRHLSTTAQLTTKSFFDNINAIKAITEGMIGLTEPPLTIARAMNILGNNLTEVYLAFEESIPVFESIAIVIRTVAENLNVLGFALVAVGANLAYNSVQAALASTSMVGMAAATNVASAAFARFKVAALAAASAMKTFAPAIAAVVGYSIGSWINDTIEELERLDKAFAKSQAIRDRAGTIADALVNEKDVNEIKKYMSQIRTAIIAAQEQISGELTILHGPGGLTDYQIKQIIRLQNEIATLEGEYQQLATQVDNVNKKKEDLGKQFGKVSEHLNELNEEVRFGEEAMLAYARGGESAATAVENVQEQFEAYNKVLDIFETTMAKATEEQLKYAQAALDATKALQVQKQALKDLDAYRDSIERIDDIIKADTPQPTGVNAYLKLLQDIGAASSTLRTSGDLEAARKALDSLTDRTQDFGKESDDLTNKLRTADLANMLKSLADAAYPDRATEGEEESFAEKFRESMVEAQRIADATNLQVKVDVQGDEILIKLKEGISSAQGYADANPVVIRVETEVDNIISEESDEVGGQE